MDLTYDGIPVVRYQYEPIDETTPERRHDTYKPFHHVFAPDGKTLITKGPGEKYPHHRGIYYGFSKCSYIDADGELHKGIDTWHCRKAHQIHQKLISKTADRESAAMSSEIAWISNEGDEFATETRTLSFRYDANRDLVVDFESVLQTRFSKTTVDGDPQHAGFQFRANNEVAAKNSKLTYYIRPKTGRAEPGATINWSLKADNERTRNLPWKAMSFVTGGDRFTVAYLDRADNPKPARYSERPYGRFGSYFVKEITPDSPLSVRYRLVIRAGEMTPQEIEMLSSQYAKQ